MFLTVGLREDLFAGLGPDEWMGPVVPVRDEGADLGIHVADAADAPAVDGLPFDDREPDLDET
jgi:hypothetical protein